MGRRSRTGAATLAGLLLLVSGLSLLVFPTFTGANADVGTSPYACLSPRSPSPTGSPWLSATSGLGWQNPTDPVLSQPSNAETQIASSLGQALGSGFSQPSVTDYANTQCDTMWKIVYQDSGGSTVELLVFQTDQVLNDYAVVNTFGMISQMLSDGTQLLTQDTDGYLDYAVTATPDGLITVVLTQGADSGWLVAGWPTTTYSPTTGPTPLPEPLSVAQASTLVQSMQHDVLSTVVENPTTTTTTTSTTTTVPTSDTAAIAAAYNTLFDFADPSVTDKEAVIQNGASLATALQQALDSSLATSATGASVDAITVLDPSSCSQQNLPSPCASVTYDIVGQGGAVLLSGQTGYAVSIDGTWLVATTTVCGLLQLFYEAEGLTGTPPGCGSSETTSSTTTTTSVGSTTSTSAQLDSGSTSTTAAGSGSPTSTTTAGPSTQSSGGSGGGRAQSGTETTSSGSLAFTGPGSALRITATVGAALVFLGLMLLAVSDSSRRVLWRLANGGSHLGGRSRH